MSFLEELVMNRFKKKSDDVFKNRLRDGRTIIHVSHVLPVIKQYADRVIFIDKGIIRKIGTPDEVIPFYRESFKRK